MYDDYNDDYQDGSDTEDDDDDENERPYTSTPQSMPFKFINGKDGMGKIYYQVHIIFSNMSGNRCQDAY